VFFQMVHPVSIGLSVQILLQMIGTLKGGR